MEFISFFIFSFFLVLNLELNSKNKPQIIHKLMGLLAPKYFIHTKHTPLNSFQSVE